MRGLKSTAFEALEPGGRGPGASTPRNWLEPTPGFEPGIFSLPSGLRR